MITTLLSPDSLDAFPTLTLKGEAGGEVKTYTLRGGLQEGVQVIEVDNGTTQFAILPSRGMGIWRGMYRGDGKDIRLGWDSPVNDPVHPSFINASDLGGLGWLKGFNEWLVRCGLASMGAPGDDNGTQLGVHGNIANIPARSASVEFTDNSIIIRGEVDETMLFISNLRLSTEIRTDLNSGAITIVDTVTNLGANPQEHEILYHVNYGSPLLEEGAQLLAPTKVVAPRDARAAEGIDHYQTCGAAETGYAEQVYFYELAAKPTSNETVTMLRNAAGDAAVVQRFSTTDFPYFTQWKNTAAYEDGYVTGLEPCTAYPNNRSFEREQGRVITLAGGESRTTTLTLETLSSAEAVETVAQEIAAIQAEHEPVIHLQPVATMSG